MTRRVQVIEALERGARTSLEVAAIAGTKRSIVGPILSELASLGAIRRTGEFRKGKLSRYSLVVWEIPGRAA
jgi:DNA-binding IclR family transcriptional regulator